MKQFKRDEKQNSKKLDLDKYFTSDETAQHCIDVTMKVLKDESITEIIEPSAGNGSFSRKIKDCIAYDIDPSAEGIIQQDFLMLDIPYKKGRLFIGNPPFGSRNTLAVKFYKKCVQLGDYIAFILPSSQYNNSQQMYEFDLIYSELLDGQKYSNRKVNTCLNIYKRPKVGINRKSKVEHPNLKIIESRLGINRPFCYDLAICAWGASIGKDIGNGHFAKEFYLYFSRDTDKYIQLLSDVDWVKEYNMTSTPNLLQWQVHHYLNKMENLT